jgi:hypothetical protein
MTFLFPTLREYVFDETCSEIVRRLSVRRFLAPGLTVKLDTSHLGTLVRSIDAPGVRLWFCRKQSQVGQWNDTAAIHDIVIDGVSLSVYGDHSGPTCEMYVGPGTPPPAWQIRIGERLHGKPRTLVGYKGRSLIHDTDLDRRYGPEAADPTLPRHIAWTMTDCKYDGNDAELGHVCRPDPILGGRLALFTREGKMGQGSPVWGRISEERQREVAVQRRCQVCSQKLGVVGFAIVMPIERVKRESVLPIRGHEPLVCTHCLPKVFTCPRVRQAYRERALYVISVAHYRLGLSGLAMHENPQDDIERSVNDALSRIAEPVVGLVELFIEYGEVLDPAKVCTYLSVNLEPEVSP